MYIYIYIYMCIVYTYTYIYIYIYTHAFIIFYLETAGGGWGFCEPGLWYLSARLLQGFVVSANLRNISWSFTWKHVILCHLRDSPQMFHKSCAEQCQNPGSRNSPSGDIWNSSPASLEMTAWLTVRGLTDVVAAWGHVSAARQLLRPISLLALSLLLTLLDSNFPGNSLWTWEFLPLNITWCLSQAPWNPQC